MALLVGQRAVLIRSDQAFQVRTRRIGTWVSDCQHCLPTLSCHIEIPQDTILLVVQEAYDIRIFAAGARIELRFKEIEPAAGILRDTGVEVGRGHQACEGVRQYQVELLGLRNKVADLVTRLRTEVLVCCPTFGAIVG